MKKLLPLIVALLSFSLFSQVKFESVPTAEKCVQKDLTFLVTFDSHGVNADFAKGSGVSTTMSSTNLGLRGVIGFDGMSAFQPESGEMLRFAAKDNFDPHQGTLIFWTCGIDYAPGDEKTDGKKRGNIALFHSITKNGSHEIEFMIYEFADNVYFDSINIDGNDRSDWNGRVAVPRRGIRKGEWHQLVFTWDRQRMIGYLNGEKIKETSIPQKSRVTDDVTGSTSPDSFIGIKSTFFEDVHTWSTGMDDVAIYNRPLTELEIRNQYIRLLKDKTGKKMEAYSILLNGVNIGRHDKIDRLEAEFDFSALSAADAALLKNGRLSMSYILTGPDGQKQSGKWLFSQLHETRILNKVDKPGRYTLTTTFGKESVTATVVRPDFSWVGNGYGDEDEVPALWKDFKADGRKITLWNRVYTFGEGPLPESITYNGKAILSRMPALKIDGKTPRWKAGKTTVEKRWVTYTGSGRIGKTTIRYATRVEFDGFIKFDWTISGKPEISSMTLDWRMAPENHGFLMTPRVNEQVSPAVSFRYPRAGGKPKMLWFVTEKMGGFAYTMVNDANWVFDDSKPVFFADKSSGECRVEMINQRVVIPEDTPYTALFIATPTRPLPKANRLIRFGDTTGKGTSFIHAGGADGINTVFSHEPHPTAFAQCMKNCLPGRATVYGGLDLLTTREPEMQYLRKYWEIPGAYSYRMPLVLPGPDGKEKKEYYFSLSACPSTVVCDYFMKGEHDLYHHKYGDRVWQSYFDICGDSLCGNRLHGCGYTDNFGRDIASFEILPKRDLIRRIVAYAHQHGRTVMLHGQRDYLPMLQGLADYWYPGEQYGTLLRRNPYGYTDEVPDAIYRTEFNRDVLGIGVIHLPALGQTASNLSGTEAIKYTESMMCMLQSHDVETCGYYAKGKVVQAVWNILEKYGAQAPETRCRLYYEQKEVTSSDPNLRITYYCCPQKRYLLFIANKDIRPANAEVDISAIANGDFTAIEEYKGKEIAVKGGKFQIRVPARSFRIVCFPPRSIYPLRDTMEKCWNHWVPAKCDTEFVMETGAGASAAPSLKMALASTGGGCFMSSTPIGIGKRYRLSIMAKHSIPGQTLSMGFQGRIEGRVAASLVSKKVTADGRWQKIEIEYTVPTTGIWEKCDNILITLGASGTNGIALFDDFQMEEIRKDSGKK